MNFLLTLLTMMVAHLVSDAFLQSREEAKGKSEDKSILYKHVRTNFLVTAAMLFLLNLIEGFIIWGTDQSPVLAFFWVPMLIFRSIMPAFWNALVHAAIDWNIWRLYKKSVLIRNFDKSVPMADRPMLLSKSFKYWEDPWFFHTIMIDQFLHYATIVAIAYVVAG